MGSTGETLRSRARRFAGKRKKDARFRIANPGRYVFDLASSSLNDVFRHGNRPRQVRILLASDGEAGTSEEQYTPFTAFRSILKSDARIVSSHLMVRDVLAISRRLLSSFDAIGLKLSFRMNEADTLAIVAKIREIAGTRPVIYFDGDDDICVKYPQILAYVDLYVKKHLFADRDNYLKTYVGKSNLTDYVHKRFGLSFADDPYATETQPVDKNQIPKIVAGWNLALDSNILALHTRVRDSPPAAERTVDVMFRGAVPGNWLKFLRQDIAPALQRLGSSCRVITPTARVDREEYYREMMRSNICLSPFGYGEICWRDFEAILCGSLIVKPDMAHVHTSPNIFQPDSTYVPVRWDYSDLEERCIYYLKHPDERRRITSTAFHVLEDYYVNQRFFESITDILRRVGLR
jgi:hypothetical protein